METKEVTLVLTKDIAEGITDLLYALTLTVRRENPHDIYMLQREAVNICTRFNTEEIKVFMEFMVSIHKPFCTATEDQMDSGHIEYEVGEPDEIGKTEISWLTEEYPGQYL